MQLYKNGKWAAQILSQRQEDGLWGNFHTLSRPVPGKKYTTEQAIRRLYYLGYTAQDEVISIVVRRMEEAVRENGKSIPIGRKHTTGLCLNSLCYLHGFGYLNHRIRQRWKWHINGRSWWKNLSSPAATARKQTRLRLYNGKEESPEVHLKQGLVCSTMLLCCREY